MSFRCTEPSQPYNFILIFIMYLLLLSAFAEPKTATSSRTASICVSRPILDVSDVQVRYVPIDVSPTRNSNRMPLMFLICSCGFCLFALLWGREQCLECSVYANMQLRAEHRHLCVCFYMYVTQMYVRGYVYKSVLVLYESNSIRLSAPYTN